MAHWQTIGFAHGVMNTDNMSILGITMDYGPFGFLDDYVPDYICNHSDHQGRYAFDNQPAVALWNLHRLGQALSGLLSTTQLQQALEAYEPELMAAYGQQMRAKLGFFESDSQDNELLTGLLSLMIKEGRDYTRTFRLLSEVETHSALSPLRDDFIGRAAFDSWYSRYRARLQQEQIDDAQRQQAMRAVNPKYILRNYLAQLAIDHAEKDDIQPLQRLHQALQQPFAEQPELNDLAALPPDWGKHLEISCSS